MINLKIYHLHNYNVATYVIIKCILNVTRISLNIIVSHYSNIERCICENMTIIFILCAGVKAKDTATHDKEDCRGEPYTNIDDNDDETVMLMRIKMMMMMIMMMRQ